MTMISLMSTPDFLWPSSTYFALPPDLRRGFIGNWIYTQKKQWFFTKTHGDFHKWWHPKVDSLFHGKSYWNGWFAGSQPHFRKPPNGNSLPNFPGNLGTVCSVCWPRLWYCVLPFMVLSVSNSKVAIVGTVLIGSDMINPFLLINIKQLPETMVW
jgi:hypothetical protein